MFVAVRCPADGSVLFEAGPGYSSPSRHKCRKCLRCYTTDGGYPSVEVWLVEIPLAKLPA